MMSDTFDLRLRDVFASLFGVAPTSLTAESSPDTINAWDSLSHISLMMAIEGEFGVQFEPSEMMSLRSFGMILDRLHLDAVYGRRAS